MASSWRLRNIRLAQKIWGKLPRIAVTVLAELTHRYSFSVICGDLLLINGLWYVTHAGLLRLASRRGCSSIRVQPVYRFCDSASGRWVFRATVYRRSSNDSFVGYGDADPSNVSPLVRGAEMRVAETRAVNRALRKAYGIGLCSVEELGWAANSLDNPSSTRCRVSPNGNSVGASSQPRLRDRLCLLIRQHQLDANLVKAYAADYCQTPALHDATREQIKAFIDELSQRAESDREGLLCHLNSYAKPTEVKP